MWKDVCDTADYGKQSCLYCSDMALGGGGGALKKKKRGGEGVARGGGWYRYRVG